MRKPKSKGLLGATRARNRLLLFVASVVVVVVVDLLSADCISGRLVFLLLFQNNKSKRKP